MKKKTPMEKAEKRMKDLAKGKIERSNKTLSTVNVIEMVDESIISLTAYPDTKAGNAKAEKHFRKICEENCSQYADLTKKDYDTMLSFQKTESLYTMICLSLSRA